MANDALERWGHIIAGLRKATGEFGPEFACILDLAAEVERLRAERDALRADAALGALVRRMPPDSKLKHTIDDQWQTDAGEEWILRPDPSDALRAAGIGDAS